MNQEVVLETEYGIFLLKIIQYGAADKSEGGASLIETDHVKESGGTGHLFQPIHGTQIRGIFLTTILTLSVKQPSPFLFRS